MKSFTSILAVLLSAAALSAAQSTPVACAAQSIVEACLGTTEGNVKLCQSTDWSCLCAGYQAIATCYANCPADPRAPAAQGQIQVFCAQASIYGTTYTSRAVSSTATAAQTTTAAAATDATTSAGGPAATGNGAAALVAGGAGGVLAAVAGVVGVLL